MKINVGILGATGNVGQRFIQMLENHPMFELTALGASHRSAGKTYEDACYWYQTEAIPEDTAKKIVVPTEANHPEFENVDIVFSALPANLAQTIEPEFAKAGKLVFSNASAMRMEADVPLIITEVNHEHFKMLETQRDNRGYDGGIVTNPNCSTICSSITLKPIMDKFGLDLVNITTMQAISGAGYDGVPSMAILDNMIPYIGGEEEKMQTENLKILGNVENGQFKDGNFKIGVSCNRVPVIDGHTESIFVKTTEEAEIEEIKKAMDEFDPLKDFNLPSYAKPIVLRSENDRPQPRLDRNTGNGMSIVVGRVREDPIFTTKYTALEHNTIRGAAGASVLNAELYVKKYL
ncbi:aspartate-semialdehyde dehydrogenase [Methanococcus voltae]|uniref:Aspartate-semialdehyde dehydrogenase n=2 Tax=Methanococcus voltae TaxID=2188 RepID=A0A8J7S3U2_METVO|nr:aspartate-semialdehyde dehydrogenase [Methanococcus voltae]MBP2172044.1 aspartate-semialdehyde dehydrogenase [Methanococcus voltae]MBP2201000.1 aspartate-semialdehyde dehydrogenase [Methanococcus voltae]MCS3921723.1 aspartate-semialdehyde dehydrogenase [Methanococcus voltae PS]